MCRGLGFTPGRTTFRSGAVTVTSPGRARLRLRVTSTSRDSDDHAIHRRRRVFVDLHQIPDPFESTPHAWFWSTISEVLIK